MTAIHDLIHVEVEHGLGLATGRGFVKIRLTADADVIILGQLPTDQARQIAGHLLDAAARADYGGLLAIVRQGEIVRQTTMENPDQ